MSKKQKIILLGVISIILVVVLSISVTTSFMKPVEQGGNLTEISLSSCAKIKLNGGTSISLTNTYPMTKNKALQTTPYTFTVTSYCDNFVGFNLYLATLNTNTLDATKIHYIITNKNSKSILTEGTLTSSNSAVTDFTDAEKTELNTGLKGTYKNIYKLFSNELSLKGSKSYDLYLYVDQDATNETMSQTFSAGVAVKAYDRDFLPSTLEDVCSSGNNLASCITTLSQKSVSESTNIYYHDSALANGAGDNSYRYAGPSASVNNFVCFGTTTSPCPTDNLYRIIGVFGKNYHGVSGAPLVKLIKYDYANSNLLGTDGDYYGETTGETNYYRGNLYTINIYYWNYKATNSATNIWSTSLLNKTNLNTNFINNIGSTWANKIATTTWKVGGNTWANIATVTPSVAYQNEVVNPIPGSTSATGETEYSAKIGLMYVSDYGFAASPSAWTTQMKYYSNKISYNWMYMGFEEWTISREADVSNIAFSLYDGGAVNGNTVSYYHAVRPAFSLNSSVTYKSGSGSMSDPIRIN